MSHEPSRRVTGVIAAATVLTCFATLASWAYAAGVSGSATSGTHSMNFAVLSFQDAYRVAPAMVFALALALSLPLVSMLARAVQFASRSDDATRRYRPRKDKTFTAELSGDAVPRSRRFPFVEIDTGGGGLHCAILRDMLRIGREQDNDIRISNASVHRYHAAIHREDYNDWHITDLSGVEGNGLIVNGRQCCEARLSDGDLIQLGPGRLRFRDGQV